MYEDIPCVLSTTNTAQDHSLWLSPPHLRPYHDDSNPPSNSSPTIAQQQAQRRQQHSNSHAAARSSLVQLRADEEAIRKRKENIARFGSTWIKPPGISKTLQAETEERQEREEQEAMARREQNIMDMQAQQELEEARQRAQEQAQAEEAGEVEEERNLDDEIPDADAEGEEDDEDEDEDDDDDDATTTEGNLTAADLTFNDESLLEGSMLDHDEEVDEEQELAEQERYMQMEEAELNGVAQDQADLGMEGNLDDSVPEAGSYQHTDTELEDDSSEEEVDDSMTGPAPRMQVDFLARRSSALSRSGRSRRGRESEVSRTSFRGLDTSSLLESSFVGSSPMLGRLRSGNTRGGRSG